MDKTELSIIESSEKQAISARELFEKLGIQERFSRWFERMVSYGFEKERDYRAYQNVRPVNRFGGEQIVDDFAVSLDMAKQICMLQRSEKGKQYRDYLVKVENAWNDPDAVIRRGYQLACKRAEEATKRALQAESVINRIANSKGCFRMNTAAKALQLPYGDKTLFKKLRELRVLNLDNSPAQEQQNAGHFKVVVKEIPNIRTKPVTLVTAKGLVYLAKKFNTEIDSTVVPDEA